MSETAKIAEALAAFQAEMPTVAKGKRADVPTKTGGKYSYTYADLAGISQVAMPLLASHGLAFSALPRARESGGYELAGWLLHTSGEVLEGALPIGGNSPQEMGSSLTYMRRYLLGCLTGLVTDDDDDGHAAQQASKKPAAKKDARANPNQAVMDMDQPMIPSTRGRMFALFAELKIPEEQQLAGINHIIGHELASRGALTEGEARQVIQVLEGRRNSARQETNA